jgi:glucosamine--fructose-6-phosphate aminotransferase (isomerizing)
MKTSFETEIYQQPEVIRTFQAKSGAKLAELAKLLQSNPPQFVLIAARGTSDNAAIYAKYLLSGILGVPVGLAMPSLYTLYQQTPVVRGGLVIGISQSGQTPDVLGVLDDARRQGVPTISITNDPESPMAEIADHDIFLHAGVEKSVPASKTFTAQLVAIATLIAYWSGDAERIDALERVPDYIEAALSQAEVMKKVAERFSKKDHLVVVGRGYNFCTTHEIALKIKELAYIVAESYSAADFRHGPIAMLESGFPVVAIAPQGKAQNDMKDMIAEVKATKADLVILTNDPALAPACENPIILPEELPDWLSPIVFTVPGQLLALNWALSLGFDPDKPRALKKVTLTF